MKCIVCKGNKNNNRFGLVRYHYAKTIHVFSTDRLNISHTDWTLVCSCYYSRYWGRRDNKRQYVHSVWGRMSRCLCKCPYGADWRWLLCKYSYFLYYYNSTGIAFHFLLMILSSKYCNISIHVYLYLYLKSARYHSRYIAGDIQ